MVYGKRSIGTDVAVSVAVGAVALLGMSGCTGIKGILGGVMPSDSSSSSVSSIADAHNATDNDKQAYYKVESNRGSEAVSVIRIGEEGCSTLDESAFANAMSANGVNWYQIIVGKNTGDSKTQYSYLYMPSGLTYDDIANVTAACDAAGYNATMLSPSDYDSYLNQQHSLYFIETCYLGPAATQK